MTPRKKPGGAVVRAEKLDFAYPGGPGMRFELSVAAGDIVALMGPSGSGKSTLLNLIAGFERPDAGRVIIGNDDVTALPPHRRPVSMVFQENNLFAHLTIAQNVGLGRSPSLRLTADDRTAVGGALARTGLSGKEGRLPNALSGGERQRLHIARALAQEPRILILDEPTNHLDIEHQIGLLDLVRAQDLTVIAALHDLNHAAMFCDRVAVMQAGSLVALGRPAEILTSRRLAEVFKVRADIETDAAGGCFIRYARPVAPSGRATAIPEAAARAEAPGHPVNAMHFTADRQD
ncbi:ABC transporter ATP-binding protein [Nitratireductor sp. GCM10026969]|uniref:ABC transporter ATP-binding protein n=1 Tax=Nitratireductor sp. GCM10026969 TaxID=3252645 RepID=UPI003616B448